jgi:hypothetical protein
MAPSSSTSQMRSPHSPGLNALSPAWRHRTSLGWPEGLLTRFSERMALHGLTVQQDDMQTDPRYALAQLLSARELGDPALAVMSEALFRCFEERQSGLAHSAH